MENLFTEETAKQIPYYLQKLLLQGRKADALRLLEKQIEADGGLFEDDKDFKEGKRISWLLRIDLLREWNRLSEALAWTCLECEINPTNVAAQALKEQLKRQLKLVPAKTNTVKTQFQPTLNWDGVAGMRELKAIFERDIILPLREPEIYELYKVTLPNGVLLYGPPGCGKTFIARKLAQVLNYNFREIKPSDLGSIYVHGAQEKIGKLFADAKASAPCMLFLDEIEAFVPSRSGFGMSHSYQAEVNEFLVHLNECEKNKILVVGATNLPNLIDPAVRRPGRLDKKIFVAPPDLEARAEAMKLYMKDRPQTEIDFIQLAEQTECYTFAELELIVNEAAREALGNRKPISTETILKSVLKNKPAHNPQLIEKMRTAVDEG
ncbi:MAG: ATP-dependent zinc metalloprotease FtsH [Bacteroidia bacterium]|nr:ATP-dependent zinc metalloprotease FtsH [Bacteroidia bacterium]